MPNNCIFAATDGNNSDTFRGCKPSADTLDPGRADPGGYYLLASKQNKEKPFK